MEEKKHHIKWEKDWLEGKINSQEAAKLASDIDSFDTFEKFIEGAQNLDVPKIKSKQEVWAQLENRISQNSSPKVISISRRNWIIGIAASFILALGAFFLIPTKEDIRISTTGLAETRTVSLPDGSKVQLNAVSSISFSEDNWDQQRLLRLNGEAFFEVVKGSQFTVETSTGSVQVLGTSFNVRERGETLIVACKTGKVRVTNNVDGEYRDIVPGNMVAIKKKSLTDVEIINTNRIALWTKNEFDFESLPTKEVFAEIERQYDLTIINDFSDNELNETFTATLPNDNLDVAIETINAIKGFKSEILDDGKVIRFFRD